MHSENADSLRIEHLVNTAQELSLAKDLHDITSVVRTVARKLTGADGATFVLRDGNLCYYVDEDSISPLWKGSRFPMEACISGWVMLNKRAAVIEDIYEDERIPFDAYRPTFVKSLAMVPIRAMEPIGAIGNYWAKKHKPTYEDMSILQALADITAVSMENIEIRNKLEEKLEERAQMLTQLKEQKKQLEEFMHIIAHNLRAPLSNLLLLNDMIEKSEDVNEKLVFIGKQKPVVESLHETFEELAKTIHVKTDFAIERDHIDLGQSFANAISKLGTEIEKKDAVINMDFSEAKTAHFPKSYIDNIILNLLDNALKYNSPERRPEINIKSYKESGWTWFQIQDNGLGIDLEKHRDKLFMLRKTFHTHANAKGFGLFITKAQIEAMGGSITVESIPDGGSTFMVKLNKNK